MDDLLGRRLLRSPDASIPMNLRQPVLPTRHAPPFSAPVSAEGRIVPQRRELVVRSLKSTDSTDALIEIIDRSHARLHASKASLVEIDSTVSLDVEGTGHCFIAEWHGALAGTVTVQPTLSSSACELLTRRGVASARQFAVEPTFCGNGIGRRLVETAEQWALGQGFHTLALAATQNAKQLLAMYTRLGYRQAALVRWPGRRGASVVFSKALLPDLIASPS